jgi:hypothetical protein
VDDDNSSTYRTDAGYYCHEKFDTFLPILDSLHFWIEGVTLTAVASIGLLGNLLTVIVIFHFDRGANNGPNASHGGGGRSPFNTILTSLVAFDSFFLMFSLMDSAYIASFHMPEPYW